MKNKIKAICFDYDDVVYFENPRFSIVLSKKYHIPINKILPFFQNKLPQCQLGKKDLKIELTKYIKKWKINISTQELTKLWFNNGGIDKKITKLIEKLKKQGLKCFLITSNEKYRMNFMIERYKLDKLFNNIFPSYKAKARKPDLKFYDYLLKITNLKPNAILLIDDNDKFESITNKLGFKSITLKNFDQLQKDLEKENKK